MTPIPDTWQELLTLIIPALLTVLGFIDKKRGWVWRDMIRNVISIYRQLNELRRRVNECDRLKREHWRVLTPGDPRAAEELNLRQEAGLRAMELRSSLETRIEEFNTRHPALARHMKSRLRY